jgi:predicted transcriptional regulator
MDAATRLEKLIAMLVLRMMTESTQREKVVLMNKAGFSNQEIAELLDTKPNIVSQHLYAARTEKTTRAKDRSKSAGKHATKPAKDST